MLLISDNVLTKYSAAEQKYNVQKALNTEKKYKISDTRLSYRQLNDLDSNKLLPDDRENKAGWRKFTYKELVYLELVSELKEFGLKREQFKQLWESFFRDKSKDFDLNNKHHAETAIGCVLGGIEMTLVIDSKGNVFFSDPIYYAISKYSKPHIKISLNEIINQLNPKIGMETAPIVFSNGSLINRLTDKEKELLKIIRDKDYSSVKVKKRDGDIAIVYAEKSNTGNDGTSPKEIEELLKNKDYMDITIIKRDGKIVNFKLEETIKL